MNYNPNIHHRRSIRLRGYDYSRSGFYFVTVCCHNRKCLFGEIIDGKMALNEYGKIAHNEWVKTIEIRRNVKLHEFIIMPNHVHGIIEISKKTYVLTCRGVARNASTGRNRMSEISPKCGTLSAIIRAYKSAVSKSIHKIYSRFNWQRNYHEHIIRNEQSYHQIAEYIENNPARWQEDKFYIPS